jgi:CDGSH iron-sulfur domain-containing protein 3
MSAKIMVKNNGSIQVDGEFELHDQEGKKFDLTGKKTIWLCRCGHSKNKPFCDGSHKAAEFKSEISAK